jgi:hypothetical protein
LAETLTISHPHSPLLRAAHLSFQPDTTIAALLRTPEGIDRFSASALGTGRFVRVADAAQLQRREHKVLKNVVRALTLGGCFVAGVGVAQENTALTVGGGSACVGGFSIELFKLMS